MSSTLDALLAHLCELDVKLWAEGGTLRCSAPPGAMTSELRGRIATNKAAILAFLEQGAVASIGIRPRPRADGRAPLSFNQQRLWFLDQMDPGTTAYNMFDALRLRGALDIAALRRAFDELVVRHEILRTTFHAETGVPFQIVHPPSPVGLAVVDLTACDPPSRAHRVRAHATEVAETTYDLTAGPLLRVLLLRLEADAHLLFLGLHHIVTDGWSMGVIAREIARLYGAFHHEVPSPLEPLPFQYADYAEWQRVALAGATLESDLAYWRGQLDGAPRSTVMADRHVARRTFRGAVVTRRVPSALAHRLEALARQENATLFMVMLAVYDVLLWRYTGERDVVVGTPIANRPERALEGMVGFFVNTLVMRTRLDERATVRALIAQVRETALGAYAHQQTPFEKLVEELSPPRELNQNPFFQVTFAVQNTPVPSVGLDGLVIEIADVPLTVTRFDLETHVWNVDGGLKLACFHSADLFDTGTIERFLEHFEQLLTAAVDRPDAAIADLDLLSPTARDAVLACGRGAVSRYPRDASLHALFEEVAARHPDRPAVRYGEQSLTYAALDARASALAAVLIETGAGPDVPVGLLLQRSCDLIVGMLAVLKTGGSYVPLDPDWPRRRIGDIAAEGGVAIVVTHEPTTALAPGAARAVSLPRGETVPRPVPGARVSAMSVACVLFTSGSTGTPKGVAVPHRGIVRLVHAIAFLGIGPTDRITQLVSPSFDGSSLEIWGALLRGAELLGVDRDAQLDPRVLADTIRTERPSVMRLTTSLFNVLMGEAPDALRGVRVVLVGGEALDPRWVRTAIDRSHPAWLVNGYGPTENSTYSCCNAIEAVPADAIRVPVGGPIADSTAYVLDARMRPMPVDVPGELYVGGDGLARGYVGRPDLTADRFVPDPFSSEPGARLYRTGDRARLLPTGEIEILGRLDRQVKLRGFRVELDEIEAVLRGDACVGDALVLLRDTPSEAQLLRAYVVPSLAAGHVPEGIEAEQVQAWRRLHDETSRAAGAGAEPAFAIGGWNSSYTRRPLPEQDMREWLHGTVERIASLRPRRVLEIGCGTGMILARVAPACERYEATDFAAGAVEHCRRLQRMTPALRHARLHERPADDLSGFEPGSFDTVILNSVVQYFPGPEYLTRVLDAALDLLAPGGALFVGDVRHLRLLEAFHESVLAARVPIGPPAAEWPDRVRQAVDNEQELVVDPAFFDALASSRGDVAALGTQLRRGRADNELTRFRYDAVMRRAPFLHASSAVPALDWGRAPCSLAGLEAALAVSPAGLDVRRIANARLSGAAGAAALATGGLDPSDVWDLGERLGFTTEIDWSAEPDDRCVDARFHHGPAFARAPAPSGTGRPSLLANRPAGAFWRHQSLAARLRAAVAERLPDYMVPATIVVVPSLPRTASGKIDRRAVGAFARTLADGDWPHVPPGTDTERRIAAIWCDLLGLERVGVGHSFFDVGGHSLLATQLVSRIRDAFGLDLAVRVVFEAPVLGALAERIDALAWVAAGPTAAASLVCADREGGEL